MTLVPPEDYIKFVLLDNTGAPIVTDADEGEVDGNIPFVNIFRKFMPDLPGRPDIFGIKGPVSLSNARLMAIQNLFDSIKAPPFKKSDFLGSNIKFNPQGSSFKLTNFSTLNINTISAIKAFQGKRDELKGPDINDADVGMFRILEEMCIKAASYAGTTPAAVNGRNKILNTISCFALSLNVKEVLDMSQIYAIISPVVELNIRNGHSNLSGNALSNRVNRLVTAVTSFANVSDLLQFINTFYTSTNNEFTKIAIYSSYESSDKASARMIGQFLPTVTEETFAGNSKAFVIATNDIIVIAALLNGIIDIDYTRIQDSDTRQKLIVLLNLLSLLKNTDNMNIDKNISQFVIDIIYYFYSTRIIVSNNQFSANASGSQSFFIMEYLKKIVFTTVNLQQMELPKWICDAIICAYFLNLFESAPGTTKEQKINYIKQLLVLNLWDSQCHDNKGSPYFRIICVIMFLMKIDQPLDLGMIDQMFDDFALSDVDHWKSKFIVDFPLLNPVNDTLFLVLFCNDQPNQKDLKKKLFYYLSCKSYDEIESALYKRLYLSSCYLFTKGFDINTRFVSLCTQKILILRHEEGPKTLVESVDQSYFVPCIFLLYTLCAVDLTIHNSITVVNYKKITTIDDDNFSMHAVSVATIIDAASQRYQPSTMYIKGSEILNRNDAALNTVVVSEIMPLFKSLSNPNNTKLGLNFISSNVKPSTFELQPSYSLTDINFYDNVSQKKIYLKQILHEIQNLNITEKMDHKLFPYTCEIYNRLLYSKYNYRPLISNDLVASQNAVAAASAAITTHTPDFMIIDRWYYDKIPNSHYFNDILKCIQYDNANSISNGRPLTNNDRPLSIFLECFDSLLPITDNYILNRKNGKLLSSNKDLKISLHFDILCNKLNNFFTTKIEYIPPNSINYTRQITILDTISSNAKFKSFKGYLELLFIPWTDPTKLSILLRIENFRYQDYYKGGGDDILSRRIRESSKDSLDLRNDRLGEKRPAVLQKQKDERKSKTFMVREIPKENNSFTWNHLKFVEEDDDMGLDTVITSMNEEEQKMDAYFKEQNRNLSVYGEELNNLSRQIVAKFNTQRDPFIYYDDGSFLYKPSNYEETLVVSMGMNYDELELLENTGRDNYYFTYYNSHRQDISGSGIYQNVGRGYASDGDNYHDYGDNASDYGDNASDFDDNASDYDDDDGDNYHGDGHGASDYGHGVSDYGHGASDYGHGVSDYGHGHGDDDFDDNASDYNDNASDYNDFSYTKNLGFGHTIVPGYDKSGNEGDIQFPPQNFYGQQFTPQNFYGQQFPPQNFARKQFTPQNFPRQQFPRQQFPRQQFTPQNFYGEQFPNDNFTIPNNYDEPNYGGYKHSKKKSIRKRKYSMKKHNKKLIKKKTLQKRKYSKRKNNRKPIRRKTMKKYIHKRKTIKKRIHKRKTRKNRSTR
jgi:hypothetical protein